MTEVNNHVISGVYLKFEVHIFAPPPTLLDLYLFPSRFIIMSGCAPQAKNFQPFFSILYILSQQGKNYAYILPIGEKYAFPPFFCPLSIIFFSPTCYSAIFCLHPGGRGVKQKNTPL